MPGNNEPAANFNKGDVASTSRDAASSSNQSDEFKNISQELEKAYHDLNKQEINEEDWDLLLKNISIPDKINSIPLRKTFLPDDKVLTLISEDHENLKAKKSQVVLGSIAMGGIVTAAVVGGAILSATGVGVLPGLGLLLVGGVLSERIYNKFVSPEAKKINKKINDRMKSVEKIIKSFKNKMEQYKKNKEAATSQSVKISLQEIHELIFLMECNDEIIKLSKEKNKILKFKKELSSILSKYNSNGFNELIENMKNKVDAYNKALSQRAQPYVVPEDTSEVSIQQVPNPSVSSDSNKGNTRFIRVTPAQPTHQDDEPRDNDPQKNHKSFRDH